jgi:hypothetical protein
MLYMKKVKVIFSAAAFALAIAGALSTQANNKKRIIIPRYEQIGSQCAIRYCSDINSGRGYCSFTGLYNLRTYQIDFSTCGSFPEFQFIYWP